jgi:hypothetical protein
MIDQLAFWTSASPARWDPLHLSQATWLPSGKSWKRLGDYLVQARQGVSTRLTPEGDAPANLLRSADVFPVLQGRGTPCTVDRQVLQRHLLAPGDVLIPRVGGDVRACCIGRRQRPLFPSSETLVLRPSRQDWGPALAALLSTSAADSYVHTGTVGTGPPTLTVGLLQNMPVPDLDAEVAQVVARLAVEMEPLAQEGERRLDLVRQEVELLLEGAPGAPFPGRTCWVETLRIPGGWSWGEVCVERMQAEARRRCKATRLRPLAELLGKEPGRQPTAEAAGGVVIDRQFLRPDWYLAVPPRQDTGTVSPPTTAGGGQGPLLQKLQEEALLVPLVGDVAAPPVLITKDLLAGAGGVVQVGLRWLPVTGFRYPRALAVVLDHPFVRAQRQRAATGSTVSHLAQEDVGRVLVPAVDDVVWARWEGQVAAAHSFLVRAAQAANLMVLTAERWCA